ncbi:unnamed protein product [Tilletia caries]|nr:unnamed protein product [Tilletia caries]
MSLLLAPFHNGMRLGQGFNSFTQMTCVDNAVVMDPERADTVINNEGVTMRILAQKMKKASVWRQMKEYVNDKELAIGNTEPDAGEHLSTDGTGSASDEPEDEEEEAKDGIAQKQLDRERSQKKENLRQLALKKQADDLSDPALGSRGNPASKGKADILTEEQLDEELNSAAKIKAAADKKLAKDREEDLEKGRAQAMDTPDLRQQLVEKDRQRSEKFNSGGTGMGTNTGKRLAWSMQKSVGTSQIVNYTSRFVDKLSEISEDMSGSAALSIKAGSFGGSGSGAFINTDKFYSSDIKFYLSVKVINQSINFKDYLEYNPIRSVSEANADRFNTVFGDCFVSGFLEGGELNAVVLIKVLNDAKKKDIMAEAQVALTKGIEIDGMGNIALAMQNIQMNTEISINVRWCGGASIKSYDEQWTIESLLAAANRFPYLASQFPQRTYAILTKYESLRSFVKLRPATVSPLKYENAALYANMLMDAFLEYKTLAKRVASDIRAVQAGVKRFKAEVPVASTDDQFLSVSLQKSKLSKFSANLEGLDLARCEIRKQMNGIVREIDAITKDPAVATKQRGTIFVGPASLQTLIPPVEYKVRKIRSNPLSGERINKEVEDLNKAIQAKNDDPEVHLFDQSQTTLPLSEMELIKVADLERDNPELAEVTRVTPPVGSLSTGTKFCTIDLGLQDPIITEIKAGQQAGVLRALSVTYSNGLSASFGDDIDHYSVNQGDEIGEQDKFLRTLSDLSASEMITAASVQVDAADDELTISVVGVKFTTNKGRKLTVLSTVEGIQGHSKTHSFERPITDAYISGFWGRERSFEDASSAEARSEDAKIDKVEAQAQKAKLVKGSRITRLGFVWTQAVVKDTLFDDESPVECQTSEKLLSSSHGIAEFGRKYPEIPQLIWGLRTLEIGGSADSTLTATKKVELERIGCTLQPNSCTPGAQWMVLPELEHINIQCGEVKISTDSKESIENIPFELPFNEGKAPQVICWIVDFENVGNTCDIKVGVNDEKKTTATSFYLKATNNAGSFETSSEENNTVTYKEVTVGWLAHDKIISPTESVFRTGNIATSIGSKGKEVHTITYETPFSSKPTKHFYALSAIKTEGSAASWKVATKESTALSLKVDIEALAGSTYSGVWISSL